MRIIAFLTLVLVFLMYGLAFDSLVNSMQSGYYCEWLFAGACVIPQQADRWLSILTLALIAPASGISLIHWFSNSLRRVTTLFGWIIVIP